MPRCGCFQPVKPGIDVQDDSALVLSDATILNFTGVGVNVSESGGTVELNIPGGSAAALPIYDDNTLLTNTPTQIDFVGTGVTATESSGAVTVTINTPNTFVAKAGDAMTGALLMPNGGVSSPALSFSGFTNTGIYHSSNNIFIGNSGVETAVFTSNNVTRIASLNINNEYSLPTVDGTANQVLKTNGSGVVTWQDDSGGSGTGVDTFVELTDTPSAFTGAANDFVRVNASATGIEFFDADTRYIQLSGDTLTGSLRFPTTTSSTPIVAHKDNVDTGLYFTGINGIGLSINGTTAFSIASNGITNVSQLSIANNFTLPIVDGISGQVLTTDGSGNVSWSNNSAGVSDFVGLTDTPIDYTGAAQNIVRVNAAGDAIEFVDGGDYFVPLTGGAMSGVLEMPNSATNLASISSGNSGTGLYLNNTTVGLIANGNLLLDLNPTSGFVTIDALNINGNYQLPTVDGTVNQVLTTDGSGGVTWQNGGSGGSSSFIGLTDTPGSLGTANQLLKMNSGATALEFFDGNSTYLPLTGGTLTGDLTVDTDVIVGDDLILAPGNSNGITWNGYLSSGIYYNDGNVLDQKIDIVLNNYVAATFAEQSNIVLSTLEIGTGVANYEFPTSDGTSNQILVTDGSGTLTWQNQSGGIGQYVSGSTTFNGVGSIANATHGLGATKNITAEFFENGTPNQKINVDYTVSSAGEVAWNVSSSFTGYVILRG